MKQRQHADHALDRIAFGSRRLAPDVVDRYGRGQIAVAEHGALRQPRGAAGILQQRHVIGAHVRPLLGPQGALGELLVGDNRRIVRQRRLRRAGPAPIIVLANDQTIEQALVEELQRGRQQRRQIAGNEHPRAGIGELVRQRDLAVERRQMYDAGPGLQRAEEIDGMIGRIAEEQGDRTIFAVAGAKESGGCRLHQLLQPGKADRPVTEFDRRPRPEFGGRCRQQVGQRAARDRIVPADAFRIELFAGMGHEYFQATRTKARHSGARCVEPRCAIAPRNLEIPGLVLCAPRNDGC